MNATATKKAGKGKSKKTAAAPAAPAVEIVREIGENTIDVQQLPLEQIRIEAKDDRIRDEEFERGLDELAASIEKLGMLQPVTVMKCLDKSGVWYFRLIAGERRVLAARRQKWKAVPGVVIDQAEVDPIDVRAAENLQREDLDEDAKAMIVGDMLGREIEKLCTAQGVKFEGLDAPAQDAIREAGLKLVAARLGWPLPRVRDYAFTAELPEEVKTLLRQGRLTLAHCRVLAQLPDSEEMLRFAHANAAGADPLLEPAKSLEDLKRDVAREIARLNKATWDLNVAFGPKHADGKPHACAKCPHNSLNRSGLFDGEHLKPENTNRFDVNQNYGVSDKDLEGGICGKLSCYRAKVSSAKAATRAAGDRIAKAVVELKPAERPKEIGNLVRAAAERCTFIEATVFGKLTKDRVEHRLNFLTPSGKAKRAADKSVAEVHTSARENAQHELRDARWKCEEKLQTAIRKHASTLERERRWLLDLILNNTDVGRKAVQYDSKKLNQAAMAKAKGLIDAALSQPVDQVLKMLAGHADDVELNVDGSLESIHWAAEVIGIVKVPPIPKLEDFLPKKAPAAAKAAKKVAKAKPAKKAAKAPADDVEDSEEEEA